jgi:aminocarboxymuconate-semialdehyde decarboxylase
MQCGAGRSDNRTTTATEGTKRKWRRNGTSTDRPRRAHGKPGREIRPKSTTIDIHSHVAIPQAAAYVKPHLDMSTIALAHFATAETKALSQKQEADIRARITGYDERLADLAAMGIDVQLVMPPPNQCYYTVPLDVAVQASRMVNDGLAEYVSRKPDRFVALGTVPLTHGGEAASELERCMKSLGMKGVEVLTNVAGGNYRSRITRRSGKRPRSWARWWSSIPTVSPRPSGSRASTSTT